MVPTVNTIVPQIDDALVDRIIDRVADARALVLITTNEDGDMEFDAATTQEEGKEALAEIIQVLGAMSIECHRRMVANAGAYKELYGEDQAG